MPAPPPSARSRLKHAASYEAGIWRSLYRWLTRRPRAADPGAALFGYASQATPLLLAFIFLSVLEIPIVPLLLPWAAVRWSLLVLGVWGVLWMLGLLASLRTNPHVVSKTGLRLRSGFQFDACVNWEQIATIRLRRSSTDRKLQIEHDQTGVSVALHATNDLEVVFREPIPVRFLDGREARVNVIRFFADDPASLRRAAQPHLARILEAA